MKEARLARNNNYWCRSFDERHFSPLLKIKRFLPRQSVKPYMLAALVFLLRRLLFFGILRVLAAFTRHLQDVIGEVEYLEATQLVEQVDDGHASPVEAVTEYLPVQVNRQTKASEQATLELRQLKKKESSVRSDVKDAYFEGRARYFYRQAALYHVHCRFCKGQKLDVLGSA